jgi:hypothetical protein
MSKWTNIVLVANIVIIVLVFIAVAHAQRAPETDANGVPYLKVNINPTNIPPMVNINPTNVPPVVNINPNGAIPRIDVSHLPEVHVAPAGCQSRNSFQTGVGQSIVGPLIVTYLHLPPQATVTLNDGRGSHAVNLGQAGQITTAIFLGANQALYFDSDVMYSGCRPEAS